MDQTLESKLKKALAGRDAADMGQFEFLNLDMVRAEAGDKWIEVRKKIYSVSAHFVEKRLHADDVVMRCRGGFILVFAHLNGAQARDRVGAISTELNRFFLGDQILKDLEIRAEAKSVSAAEFAQILQMSSKPRAGSDAPQKAPEAKWKNRPDGSPGGPPSGAAGWADGDGPKTAASGASWKDDAPVARDRRDRGAAPGTETERKPGKSGWQEAVEGASATADSDIPDAVFTEPAAHWDDIIFKPFWDAKLGVISANLCLARRIRNGKALYGRDTLRGDTSKSLQIQLDRSVAMAAQRGFQQMFAQGAPCAIAIPVHYDTVRSVQERVAYFSILQSVPQNLRRYFYLRVDNIPEGAPLGQMQEIFRSMKFFGSNLLAKIPLNYANMKAFEGCRVDLFGSEIPDKKTAATFKDAEVQALAARNKACKGMSAGCFLTHVSSFDLLNLGISTGVRFFSGTAIGVETALPSPVTPLSFVDLHQRQQERLRRQQARSA